MTMLHLTWTKITSFLFRSWCFFFGKVKSFQQMINKDDCRCNYNKPKSQKKTQKIKTKRKTVTWESKSSIGLLSVQSHITPHLQSFVHGSKTFWQEQRPDLSSSAIHPQFVSSLHTSDTLGCVIHGSENMLLQWIFCMR